jgi:hypothetical protein
LYLLVAELDAAQLSQYSYFCTTRKQVLVYLLVAKLDAVEVKD